MTAQVSDKVIYNDERYSLVGISGTTLFEPRVVGLQPRWSTSSCFHGFHCTYALKEHALVLERLFISLPPEQTPPLLHDVHPREHEPPPRPPGESVTLARLDPKLLRERAGLVTETDNDDQTRKRRRERKPPRRYIYEDVNLSVDFTGGLLLGRDFIRELYVHMGFHPAWKYREVHELVFEDGVLQSHKDCSQEMSWVRLGLAGRDRPTSTSDGDVKRWISGCYSLEYTR